MYSKSYKTFLNHPLPPPDVGIQTKIPSSGGWSRDQSWPPSWCVFLKLLYIYYTLLLRREWHSSSTSVSFSFLILPTDQFCPIYWNNHHPGSEAPVSRHRRKWIKHLSVSASFYHVECAHPAAFSSVKRQPIKVDIDFFFRLQKLQMSGKVSALKKKKKKKKLPWCRKRLVIVVRSFSFTRTWWTLSVYQTC